jgi:hypothetical protein
MPRLPALQEGRQSCRTAFGLDSRGRVSLRESLQILDLALELWRQLRSLSN